MALRFSTGLRNRLMGINTEMITNGAFSSDTTGWTAVTAALSSAAGGQSGNGLQVAESGGADPGKAYQDITTKVGHFYKLSLYFKKGTADYGKFMVGTTADEDAIYASANLNDAAWAQYTVGFTATATTTRITLQSNDATAGETSLFDTVVLHCESHSLQDIFNGGQIEIYSGAQPTEPDDVPSGTLLVTIKNGASGITFDDAAAGVLSKASGETWSGTAVATNTAGYFRLVAPGDLGTDNATDCRIDGAIATSGSQLNLSSTAIATGAVETITAFTITLPLA